MLQVYYWSRMGLPVLLVPTNHTRIFFMTLEILLGFRSRHYHAVSIDQLRNYLQILTIYLGTFGSLEDFILMYNAVRLSEAERLPHSINVVCRAGIS